MSSFLNYPKRNLLLLYTASIATNMGSWILKGVITWIIWEGAHSAFWIGLIGLIEFVPYMVLTPIFGSYADVLPLKRSSYTICMVLALLSLLGYLLYINVQGNALHIAMLVLYFCICIATTFSIPVHQKLFSAAFDGEYITKAVAINSMLFNSSKFVAPLIGILLVKYHLIGFGFIIDAASYFFVFMTTFLFIYINPLNSSGLIRCFNPFQTLFASIIYCYKHITISELFYFTMVGSLFSRGIFDILPIIMVKYFHVEADRFFVMSSIVGGAAIISGIINHIKSFPRVKISLLSPIIATIFILLALWIENYYYGLILFGFASFAFVFGGTNTVALLHLETNHKFKGRVLSLYYTMLRGFGALSAFIMGSIINLFDIQILPLFISLLFIPLLVYRIKKL